VGVDERAETGDAGRDQQDVGHSADGDNGQDVLAPDALTQHEGVLRADRGDQRERGDEADK
jgi:hypothetical protein